MPFKSQVSNKIRNLLFNFFFRFGFSVLLLQLLNMNQLSSIVSQSFHSKTYSLPTAFDNVAAKTVEMPIGPVNETPLPHGWTCEKTSNGQIYFIKYLILNDIIIQI